MDEQSSDQQHYPDQDGPDRVRSSKSRHERVRTDQAGQRIDNFLIRQCPGVPRNHIYQMIRKGDVRVDGKRIKQTRKLVAGEQVRIPALQIKAEKTIKVPNRLASLMQASVIFEHPDFLIINKPAGIAVHAGSGLAFGVIDALRQQRNDPTLELTHRLDRATSGCLLIGKGLANNRQLQQLFRARDIEKRYLALVDGQWPQGLKEVAAPLLKNVRHAGERRVMVDPKGQPSRTCFSIGKLYQDATLLQITLDTGRTHQIRVHCKHAGHCVVGDTRYGNNHHNASFRKLGLKRLYLHSRSLKFEWNGQSIHVQAPTDETWDASMATLTPLASKGGTSN